MSAFSLLSADIYNKDNKDWVLIKDNVNQLFKDRYLKELKLKEMSYSLLQLVKRDTNNFWGGVYKNTLIIPGMTEHLLKDIEHLELEQLLVELGRMWNEFMTTILPTLEVIFVSIGRKDNPQEFITLTSFRDQVVLKTKLKEAILESVQSGIQAPPEIVQMLLVLGNQHDHSPNQRLICDMCSLVVKPYLHPFFEKHYVTDDDYMDTPSNTP